MYNFDGSTNSSTLRILASIENEKMREKMRPMSIANKPNIDPTFKTSHKDNNMPYLPPTAIQRLNDNKYKEIPHKDFLPIYANPYYTPNETGWININYNDIFRN